MFVKLVWMYLGRVDLKGISQVFSPQLGVSYSLYSGSEISRHKSVRTSFRDKQEVCPGYDDNGEPPVGCFFTKNDLIAMGVIRQ